MGVKENEREFKLRLAMLAARKNETTKIKLISEIVGWMAAEVARRGKLNHHEAANEMRQRSPYEVIGGIGLIHIVQERDDRDGSIREVYRFGPAVLEAFKELTGKTVKWGKQNRYWIAIRR